MLRVDKPWGHELWYAVTEFYAGKILHVRGGERLSLQLHAQKDETCYVLAGKLLLIQGPSVEALQESIVTAGTAWRNRPGVVHTVEALEDSQVLEVSTP